MIVANNVALGDIYTDAQTYLSLSAQSVTLFVFNNPVAVKTLKRNPGGGHDYQETSEQILAPGTITFQNCVGVKLKNANPGQVVRIFVTIPEYDPKSPDPVGVGFVPTTTLISSSGSLTGQALQMLSVIPFTSDLVLTTTIQDITNASIAFNVLGSNAKLLYVAVFDFNVTVAGIASALGYVRLDGAGLGLAATQPDIVERTTKVVAGITAVGSGAHILKLQANKGNVGGTASVVCLSNHTGLAMILQDAWMADIRGIPLSTQFQSVGRLKAKQGISAGFTVGNFYHCLAIAIDCLPAPPVAYVITIDDNKVIRHVVTTDFIFDLYPDA